MSRVMVIGLDGATFDIIEPLIEAGRLPNLAHVFANGSHGRLRSTVPPVTPAAWTSVFTGKNPGKHGIFDFERINPGDYSFETVRTHRHREKTIWQLLGEAKQRSLVIDVPFTYPPQPLNGWMITGYGTPRTAGTIFTYPVDLATYFPTHLQSEIKVALPEKKFDRSQRFIDQWDEVMQGRHQLLNWLVKRGEWDFFMVVFSVTDNMAHVFWTYVDPAHPNYYKPEAQTYREAFFKGYEQCDRIVGDLLEHAGSDVNTLLISDHGFGSVRPRQYVTRRLLKGGYIVPVSDGRRRLSGRSLNILLDLYNRFPVAREWVKGLRPGQRNRLRKTLRGAGAVPSIKNLDMARSSVVPTNFGLRMWINEKGRFDQGFVNPADKEAVIEELEAYLLADRDKATGKTIIRRVYRGRDIYHGQFAGDSPDLIIEYTNLFRFDGAGEGRNPYVEGGHTMDGILLGYGPDIGQRQVTGASLIDLAPTVLYLAGQPVPPDMDGQVLSLMLEDELLAARPIKIGGNPAQLDHLATDHDYTAEQESEIRRQLRDLGYI